mmetsp:Transcript_141267/g.439027  ORF Transcript_141267/g.439027 Transcript_141267/m.439027 type:complete len:255 (-) Transcript_141267:590-1354(-)
MPQVVGRPRKVVRHVHAVLLRLVVAIHQQGHHHLAEILGVEVLEHWECRVHDVHGADVPVARDLLHEGPLLARHRVVDRLRSSDHLPVRQAREGGKLVAAAGRELRHQIAVKRLDGRQVCGAARLDRLEHGERVAPTLPPKRLHVGAKELVRGDLVVGQDQVPLHRALDLPEIPTHAEHRPAVLGRAGARDEVAEARVGVGAEGAPADVRWCQGRVQAPGSLGRGDEPITPIDPVAALGQLLLVSRANLHHRQC